MEIVNDLILLRVRNVLLLFLLLSVGMSYAQPNDSLAKKYLQGYRKAETDSLKLEYLFAVSVTINDPDSAIFYAQRTLQLAEKLGDSLYMALSSQTLGDNYTLLSNHTEALRYDLEALSMLKKLDHQIELSNAYNNVGEDYLSLDLYNEAYQYYQLSLKTAKHANDPGTAKAIAFYNIGRVLIAMEQFSSARDNILKSMKYSAESGDTIGLAYSKHDLARIEMHNGNTEMALNLLKASYDLSLEYKERSLTPQTLVTMAMVYEKTGDYDNALSHYNDALELYESLGNKEGVAAVLYGKGIVYMRQNDYGRARSFLSRSLALAEDLRDNSRIIKCFEALSMLYEKERKFEYALTFYQKYKQFEDSVFSEKKKEQFSQLQLQYETAQKDLEIQLLNEKERQQVNAIQNQEFIRNILVVILAFTAVLLFTLHKNNVKRRKNNELLIRQRAEIEAKSKELEGLLEVKDKFFSIISHDLRSPINALIGIMDIMDDGNLTQQELKELSAALNSRLKHTKKLLDTLLDWAMLQMDVIKLNKADIDLKDAVRSNLSFYEDTADKSLNYVNEVGSNIMVKADPNMLDLVLRNLLSNAAKFTDEDGVITISAEETSSNAVTVSVADDGIGMSEEQIENLFDDEHLYSTPGVHNEKGTGLGLKLCKEFVEKMGGNIWVESLEGKGSIFKFTVPKA